MLPSRLRFWLKRTFALADGIETFATSTIATKRRALERSLADILAAPTECELAHDLQMKFRRARDQLLVFAAYPGLVEPTNNACETRPQTRRPSSEKSPTATAGHVGRHWRSGRADRRRYRSPPPPAPARSRPS